MNAARTLHVRLAGAHAARLRAELFADGREAVMIALCGRHVSEGREVLLVRELVRVPPDQYSDRHRNHVTWSTQFLPSVLQRANRESLSLLKVHSHPSGFADFSSADDRSDQALFESVRGWVDDVELHGSAIALPDGSLLARAVRPDGSFRRAHRVLVASEGIEVFGGSAAVPDDLPSHSSRHALALGAGTTRLLRELRVGVVGCSGTGSFVVEQLLRLGVGELVVVDPDPIEQVNLNRVTNATMEDARVGLPKVRLVERTARAMDLGTEVVAIERGVAHPEAVQALASCDVVFGCVDSHDGRRVLNRLATFYVIPYIDVGVLIELDDGSISHISGAVHYLQPGGSSLLSRGVIDNDRADAEAMDRAHPDLARERRREGYLRGAGPVARPAVISINGLFASMAVTELLARLHGFRINDYELAEQRMCLTDTYLSHQGESAPCENLLRHVGRGDVEPLLDMPELSEAS